VSATSEEVEVLKAYGLEAGKVTLINESENRTFRIDAADGAKAIMRAYRPGHRSFDEITSELDWMAALAADAGVATPAVIRTTKADRIHVDAQGRFYVVFSFLAGVSPPEDDLPLWFGRLGNVCARIHAHGQTWRPAKFTRPTFDIETLVGAKACWGRWDLAPGLTSDAKVLVDKALTALTPRVAALTAEPGATGLVHGDLRLANLLVDGDELVVIDFDDCGRSWLLFDLATALSLIEDHPDAPAAAAAWLQAYDAVRPLSALQRRTVPDLIMMRRIQVLSWFASHAETDLAREYGPGAIAATVDAADHYLRGQSPFRQ